MENLGFNRFFILTYTLFSHPFPSIIHSLNLLWIFIATLGQRPTRRVGRGGSVHCLTSLLPTITPPYPSTLHFNFQKIYWRQNGSLTDASNHTDLDIGGHGQVAFSQVFSYILYEINYVKHIFFKKGKKILDLIFCKWWLYQCCRRKLKKRK